MSAGDLLRTRSASEQHHVHMVLRGQNDASNERSAADMPDTDCPEPSQFREVCISVCQR